jgi:hypothetical protein
MLTLFIIFSGVEDGSTYCLASVELSHFDPNTTYSVHFYIAGHLIPHLTWEVTTDSVGYLFSSLFSGSCNNLLMVA